MNFSLKWRGGAYALATKDPYHSATMLSLGEIKGFVFARKASARREFSARLAVQKQSFFGYSPETQHGRRVNFLDDC